MRYEDLLGLRALQRARDLAVPEDPLVLAVVEEPAGAEEAFAAGGHERADDAIARRHALHAVARGDHGAHELVTDGETGLDRMAAVVDVQVRAAHARRLDAHDCVVGLLRLGLVLLLEADLSGHLEGDGAHATLR